MLTDKNDEEEGISSEAWPTNLPTNIVGQPKNWNAQHSTDPPKTTSEAFGLYFDDAVLNMVTETNRDVYQTNKPGWYNLSKDELKVFLGMLLLMIVNPSHHYYLYWSSDSFFNVPKISNVMSFKWFQAVLNYIHLSDKLEQKKKGEDGYCLGKIRPLVTALNERFTQNHTASSH